MQQESYLSDLTSVRDQGFTWQTPASLTSNRFNELLGTDAFVRAVVQKTDLEAKMDDGTQVVEETLTSVRNSIWASPIGDNHMEINVVRESPLEAFQLAEGTIETYRQWQINADRNQSVAAEGFFGNLLSDYKAELDGARAALETYLLANPEPLRGDRPVTETLEIQRLQQDIELAQTRYSNALGKEEDARLATAQAESVVLQRFSLIDAPRIPTSPELGLRDIATDLAIFGIIGALISGAMIVSGAILDRSLFFPIDVKMLLQLDVLATIPFAPLAPATTPAAQSVPKSKQKPRRGRPGAF